MCGGSSAATAGAATAADMGTGSPSASSGNTASLLASLPNWANTTTAPSNTTSGAAPSSPMPVIGGMTATPTAAPPSSPTASPSGGTTTPTAAPPLGGAPSTATAAQPSTAAAAPANASPPMSTTIPSLLGSSSSDPNNSPSAPTGAISAPTTASGALAAPTAAPSTMNNDLHNYFAQMALPGAYQAMSMPAQQPNNMPWNNLSPFMQSTAPASNAAATGALAASAINPLFLFSQ